MAKLTKQQAERHHQAEELLQQVTLTLPEREFVLEAWNPSVASNVTRQAAFFTPNDLASTFAIFARCGGPNVNYIDLCAGNGRLMRALIDAHSQDPAEERGSQRYVCVELDPRYVEVGRKCVPEATWICGDVFDLELIAGVYAAHGPFTCAVSNPPFGSVPTKRNGAWLKFHGPSDLMVAEIACRMAASADLLLPAGSVPYDANKREIRATELTRKWEAVVGRRIYPNVSVDVDCYDFEDVKPKIMLASLESLNGDSNVEPLGFDDVLKPTPISLALPLFA